MDCVINDFHGGWTGKDSFSLFTQEVGFLCLRSLVDGPQGQRQEGSGGGLRPQRAQRKHRVRRVRWTRREVREGGDP